MDKLTIRDMQENDLPAVLAIEQISFSTPFSKEYFFNELYKKHALLKVAVSEGQVIGYICADYHLHEAQILNLAIHPDFRRRGAATILMTHVMKGLKKKGCVFLYLVVRASTTGAQKFYERLGFKVEAIRKKYYSDPVEDALQMMGRL
jgi:ribosomal-protein-alanine N-acetyltransferase